MANFYRLLISVSIFILSFLSTSVSQVQESNTNKDYKYSIDFSPMSILFKIYAIDFCYRITPTSEIIAGPYYANIHYKDIGNTDAPGFIIGFRQHIWGKLHIDYQVIPQWDHFYEMNEKKTYPSGFDLWNEFRLGYYWDFKVAGIPAFINVQWPFGFALYSDGSAKPESFKNHVKGDPYFYFPPMFFIGVRF